MAPRGLHVVDSSAWFEYFLDTERAPLFAAVIEDSARLIVPVISLYEVFKKVLRTNGEAAALQVAAQMQRGELVALDEGLALAAASLPLPLADSLIYATARRYGATLWTQDQHFEGIEGVRYFDKRSVG